MTQNQGNRMTEGIPLDEYERSYHARKLQEHAQLVIQVSKALEANDGRALIESLNIWHSPASELREQLYRFVKMQRGIDTVEELFQPAVTVPVTVRDQATGVPATAGSRA